MASWIIVNSRWVLGSSKGTRQFSARSTANSPAASSAAPAPTGGVSIVPSVTLPDCTLSESTAERQHRAQRDAPGLHTQRKHGGDERSLREHRVAHLARGAHALEGRARLERGPCRAKPRRREQVDQQEHVSLEAE